MAFIQSDSIIMSSTTWRNPKSSQSLSFYDGYSYDYATIYRTQPNVRTAVEFLARNIAQLGLHVYKRNKNNDRIRLREHPLAKTIEKPLPEEYKVTRYRLMDNLVSDLGIYFNAYWLKIKRDGNLVGLLRLPPYAVQVEGGFGPTNYKLNLSGEVKDFAPDEIVHFRGYSPDNLLIGLSPLETLRRVLAEEDAAGRYREKFWQNAARMGGIIERPATAPEWSEQARARFKQEFEALYTGTDSSGKTAILEEGMTWREAQFSAEESQYLAGRKLTREEVARAYHIPLPLVGILDHATFSNISEQHKMLYTETLGPWLAMIEQEIQLQLMPEFEDIENVYVEFNIEEKMQGDFESQAQSFQTAVGRPWMTANEARGRLNMPSIEGGDELVTPLNVITGGQASPNDSAPKSETKSVTKSYDPRLPEKESEYEKKWSELFVKTFIRQRAHILSKASAKSAESIEAIFDQERWNKELAEDVYELNMETIMVWAKHFADQLGVSFDRESVELWAQKNAQYTAEGVNYSTLQSLIKAEENTEDDRASALKHVFEIAIASGAYRLARSRVTTLSNYGTISVAKRGDNSVTTKTWNLGGGKEHRSSHVALAGETVAVNSTFSNGMKYPGDMQATNDASEIANCTCYLTYN